MRTFLSQYDTFLFDCDGVLWSGPTLFPRIAETLSFLRAQGKRLCFVTNNSTASREQYQEKLVKLGIPAEVDEIFPSSFSTAVYVKNVLGLPAGSRIYVVGEAGIRRELEAQGYEVLGADSPAERTEMLEEHYVSVRPDPSVRAVVVGLDRHVNYYKLSRAYQHLRTPGTHFLATNLDNVFPRNGTVFPGAGSIVAPLRCMTHRDPVSLGKPSAAMMDAIESVVKFDRARACMVGDRLDTDAKFGVVSGLGGTLAVLTGVCTEEDILERRYGVTVGYYMGAINEILKVKEEDEVQK